MLYIIIITLHCYPQIKYVVLVITRSLAFQPPTYAIGALSPSGAHYTESRLDSTVSPPRRVLLTSNGGISPFIKELMTQLQCERVPSGGAGNKVS